MYREMRRAPARGHDGEGRRCPGPARQRQRRVCHRRELAAARRGAVPRRAAGGDRARRRRTPAPVHAIPRGLRRRSRSCPPTTCTARCTSNSTRASEHFAKVVADLVPAGATVAVDEMTGAMRRAADRLFPGGPPSDAALVVGAGQAGEDVRSDLLHPQGVPHHRRGRRRGAEGRWRRVSGRSTCRHSSCGAPSNSAPRPTCSRPSGR